MDVNFKLKNFLYSDTILFFFITAGSFFVRLPFLLVCPGYGSDPDAWRVVYAAEKIASCGNYYASRLPGYPVHEFVCSVFVNSAPFLLNTLTLIFSSFAIAFFVLIIKKFKLQNIFISGLTLAFTPILFVNSLVTLDYVWALAFILGSLYFILEQRPITAGIMLGIAIGCRLTSGAMCLPIGLIFLQKNQRDYKRLSCFIISSLIIGAVCFTPVFLKYGREFFSYNPPADISIHKILRRMAFQVWGDIGFYAIIISILIQAMIFLFTKKKKPVEFFGNLTLTACFASILLYIICFLKLPDEAAYLIPAIPFVLLLLNVFLRKKIFIFVCLAIVVSAFITLQKKYLPPFPARYRQRVYRQNMIDDVSSFIKNNSNEKKVIVCFDWYPFLAVGLGKPKKTKFLFDLDKPLLKKLLLSGFKVYYIPNKRELTYRKHRAMLKANGAKPLFK
ncbi:hypothetical protein J7L67_02445 [bacterium]|nr:hypothetical protein [bacterium]